MKRVQRPRRARAALFPALILGCLATLRPVKAWLVASQFVNKAEEGKFESLGRHDHDPRRL